MARDLRYTRNIGIAAHIEREKPRQRSAYYIIRGKSQNRRSARRGRYDGLDGAGAERGITLLRSNTVYWKYKGN